MGTNYDESVATASDLMGAWLAGLPPWHSHPRNASGSVSAHSGPTILSEHDCVMHFARFLAQAGVPWEDLHLELSPGQWMYQAKPNAPRPKRVDLAIVGPRPPGRGVRTRVVHQGDGRLEESTSVGSHL